MRVLLVRHGWAENAGYRDGRIIGDAERELTEEGRVEVERLAVSLSSTVGKLSGLYASPFCRAQQTAAIISDRLGTAVVQELKSLLSQGSVLSTLAWLEQQAPDANLCLVGHQPSIGLLAGMLLCGDERAPVAFSPGTFCMIDFPGHAVAGSGQLLWLVNPAISRT